MQISVITLRYNEALQGFPEEALRAAMFAREVLNVTERFFNRDNNNPSNDNNNRFRLVSTVSEQTGFHFDTPALRENEDEHAQNRPASSLSHRRAGVFV